MKKKKMSKKKKITIFIILVLLFVIILGRVLKPKETVETQVEIANIEKRTIAKSISATGVIKSENTKIFTSTLTGSKIETVNVKKGDKIQPGDVICTFDTKTIEQNLNTAQATLNNSQAQSNIGIQSAQRNLNDAINNKDTQVSTTQADVDSAKKAYDDAQNQLNSARNTLASTQQNYNNYVNTYNSSFDSYSKIKAEYDIRENAYNKATNDYASQEANLQNIKSTYDRYFQGIGADRKQINIDGTVINPADYKLGVYATEDHKNADTNYNSANTKLIELQTILNTAKSNYLSYKATYDNAEKTFMPIQNQYQALQTALNGAQEAVSTLEATTNNLKSVYDKSVTALNSTVSAADSTIASMQDALKNSELTANSATISGQSQINAYKDQLEKGKVISTVSGTVTSVDVKKGDIYSGSSIATVEGVEHFIIETEIDEYDIPDVSVGMKVLIKTDATRDEELEGIVTYVASSATTSNTTAMSATTMPNSNATYKVEIELNSQNDRLRLGMNAKLSIITEMKENVLSVPYDCVHKRDDGTNYIEISKDENGENKEEVNVELGIEGIYYVEIKSDKINEGMKVILPKVDTGNSIESLIEMMGPEAGI